MTEDCSKWYAIYTRSRFEKKLYALLRKAGYTAYLPLVKEKRVWSDRIKSVMVPLLPSYVFVFLPCSQMPGIYPFPGFLRFVSFEGKPCEIKAWEIELMQKIVHNDIPVQQAAYCRKGDLVKIAKGPMKGWEGRVEQRKNKSRIVFQFQGLQQAISIDVSIWDLERVS